MKGNTWKYLKYAIGEIVLVMIGILLALQVNNWNENRKLNLQIKSALKTITNDLIADTTAAAQLIEYYDDNQKNSLKILKGELTKENYKDCRECVSLVTIYRPFNLHTRGIERLKSLSQNNSTQNDSLILDLNKLYTQMTPVIEKNNERMENIVMTNFRHYEKQPWFLDLVNAKFSDEMISYFTESEDYKRRVASHAMLAVGNHVGVTKQFKSNATDLINRINQRLKTE